MPQVAEPPLGVLNASRELCQWAERPAALPPSCSLCWEALGASPGGKSKKKIKIKSHRQGLQHPLRFPLETTPGGPRGSARSPCGCCCRGLLPAFWCKPRSAPCELGPGARKRWCLVWAASWPPAALAVGPEGALRLLLGVWGASCAGGRAAGSGVRQQTRGVPSPCGQQQLCEVPLLCQAQRGQGDALLLGWQLLACGIFWGRSSGVALMG